MSDKDTIRQLAERFRQAILKSDKEELPLSLSDFPLGSCADASILLGTYLEDHGIAGFMLIKGRRGEGDSLETHCWLERGDTLVDITADQFEEIDQQVIVTSTDSEWHRSFDTSVRHEAAYRAVAAIDVREHLNAVYDYIREVDAQEE